MKQIGWLMRAVVGGALSVGGWWVGDTVKEVRRANERLSSVESSLASTRENLAVICEHVERLEYKINYLYWDLGVEEPSGED